MTPELSTCVDLPQAAERSGDLETALEWYRGVPMFRRGRNVQMLAAMVAAGLDELPDWVWARYLAYLVTRCEHGEVGHLVRDVAAYVGPAVHEELMEDCYDDGGDPIRVLARVCGESWVFHQVAAHEAGGLAAYIDQLAVGRLAERADLARRWSDVGLSGYQIGERSSGGLLRIREAGGSGWLEVLDLGARACAQKGWVLARVVPSGVGDLLMFDRHPLGVTERVAVSIAESDDWFVALTDALGGRRLAQGDLLREDYELMSDVPELELLRFGTPACDHDRVMVQLRAGRDEVGRAASRILGRARRGEIEPTDSAYVGAALLNPRAHERAQRELRPEHRTRWKEIAEHLPSPARARALALATAS